MWQLGNGSRRPCPILEIPRRTHVCKTSKARRARRRHLHNGAPTHTPPPRARALTLLPLAWFFQRDHSSSLKWKDSAPSYLFIECVSGSTNSKSEKQQKQLQSPRRVRRASPRHVRRARAVCRSESPSKQLAESSIRERKLFHTIPPTPPLPSFSITLPPPLWVLLGLGHPDLVADATTTAACGIHRLLDEKKTVQKFIRCPYQSTQTR